MSAAPRLRKPALGQFMEGNLGYPSLGYCPSLLLSLVSWLFQSWEGPGLL